MKSLNIRSEIALFGGWKLEMQGVNLPRIIDKAARGGRYVIHPVINSELLGKKLMLLPTRSPITH